VRERRLKFNKEVLRTKNRTERGAYHMEEELPSP